MSYQDARAALVKEQTAEAITFIEGIWDIEKMTVDEFHKAMYACIGKNFYYDAIFATKPILFERNPTLLAQLKLETVRRKDNGTRRSRI